MDSIQLAHDLTVNAILQQTRFIPEVYSNLKAYHQRQSPRGYLCVADYLE
ncbi:hypothetical protein SS50377_26039 [Spironucleus salmonicida]|uniref:Uncharacterized protein n=1 Tax=Spironucleus salmonicida TaxID=348837 RepID=V6LDL6_9EUKA|nr:hypothetical protein SS50377_26039 [Spironucleus salmonicida]|eukprot:EST42338.1 Hypothetical protein SS50377_18127 [Spironucleus salmonicida]